MTVGEDTWVCSSLCHYLVTHMHWCSQSPRQNRNPDIIFLLSLMFNSCTVKQCRTNYTAPKIIPFLCLSHLESSSQKVLCRKHFSCLSFSSLPFPFPKTLNSQKTLKAHGHSPLGLHLHRTHPRQPEHCSQAVHTAIVSPVLSMAVACANQQSAI